jgi:hypothetical protein
MDVLSSAGKPSRLALLGVAAADWGAGICCFGYSIFRNLQMTDCTLYLDDYLVEWNLCTA